MSELNAIANLLSLELLKVQKVFDVRWAFSSFVSVRAVLHDYPALFQHFSDNADSESNRTSKEKSKYRGLAKKLQSWFLLSETCSLKDGLRSIKQLSLYLQSNNATVMRAMDHTEILKDRLLALEEGSGQTLKTVSYTHLTLPTIYSV